MRRGEDSSYPFCAAMGGVAIGGDIAGIGGAIGGLFAGWLVGVWAARRSP